MPGSTSCAAADKATRSCGRFGPDDAWFYRGEVEFDHIGVFRLGVLVGVKQSLLLEVGLDDTERALRCGR